MDAYRVAFNTWQEKTEWVQKDKRFDVLLPWGKHRADVLKEYIDHLEARCAELAAENAGLKKFCEDAAFYADYEAELGMERGGFTEGLSLVKTQQTDAFLAEVRAQGVEQLASLAGNECQRYKSVNDRAGARKWKSIVILCTDFAAQLRKGVQ